ncbi:MAG: hypothetical protein ACLP5H_32780, partial [Desulfomonilaceae bacterium]
TVISFFINMTTVFYLRGLVGDLTGAFLGSEEPSLDRAPAPRNPKCQDRRIILDNMNVAIHVRRRFSFICLLCAAQQGVTAFLFSPSPYNIAFVLASNR